MKLFANNHKPIDRDRRQAKLIADLVKVNAKLDRRETEIDRLLRRAEEIAKENAGDRLLLQRYSDELDRERAKTEVSEDTIEALVASNKLLLSRMDADMAVQSARATLAQPRGVNE